MKVSELIERLSQLDQDADVEVGYEDVDWAFNGEYSVEVVTVGWTKYFDVVVTKDGVVRLGEDINTGIA